VSAMLGDNIMYFCFFFIFFHVGILGFSLRRERASNGFLCYASVLGSEGG